MCRPCMGGTHMHSTMAGRGRIQSGDRCRYRVFSLRSPLAGQNRACLDQILHPPILSSQDSLPWADERGNQVANWTLLDSNVLG